MGIREVVEKFSFTTEEVAGMAHNDPKDPDEDAFGDFAGEVEDALLPGQDGQDDNDDDDEDEDNG